MKRIYKKILKNRNGISLIALTTTILVLSIVTSIVVYNAKDNVQIREYKKLESDLEVLQEKVEMYYLKKEKLPVLKKNDIIINYTGNLNFKNNMQANDNENYYVIDLRELGGISLNFGNGFYNINNSLSNYNEITDLYVVNEQSHRIYYVEGVEVDGMIYYTIGTDTNVPVINN